MTWHLIETTTPDLATVVWSGSRRVDFGALLRLEQRVGLGVSTIVDTVRKTRERLDQTLDSARGPQRVVVIPSIGVDGVVHAVSVWADDPDIALGPAPIVGAAGCDFGDGRVLESADDYLMHSIDLRGYQPYRDLGMFFAKVIGFERVAELVKMATNPLAIDQFHGDLTLKHDAGHIMRWQAIARIDHASNMLRGFGHDITSFEPPVISTAEMARLDLGPSNSKAASALIGFPADTKSSPVLAYWLTSPPECLENEDITASWEFDPESVDEMWRVQQLLASAVSPSTTLTTSVRLRAPHRQWVKCDLTCSKYPLENVGAGILVTGLTVADDR